MLLTTNTEDHVVAGKTSLDHDITPCHLSEQFFGIILVHDIVAVPDTLGMSQEDGLPNMKGKAIGRDKTRRKFARVECHMCLWVFAVKKIQHLHLDGEVLHRRQ